MEQKSIRAHAKINLTLDVVGRRDDGYHFVQMIMQSIGLHDDVTVTIRTGSKQIDVSTANGQLSNDRKNLCYRAAELFLQETGVRNEGIHVGLAKRIPISAGLAGGSTDAAATLVLLNDLYQTGLTTEQLCEMGLKLGADVPFCIMGGTMLSEGIGERLTRLPDAPNPIVVLCRPPFPVSTPAVYQAIDNAEITQRPDNAAMLCAIEQQDIDGIAKNLANVMQPITAAMHPEILQIRQALLNCGAIGSVMSGSGPTTFGLFTDRTAAQNAYDMLKEQYPDTILSNFSAVSLDEIR